MNNKVIDRRRALIWGLVATAAVFAADVFNGLACYKHGLGSQLVSFIFVAAGFTPGLFCLSSKNPMRAIGAAICFIPWLGVAYWTDCVRPYQGGGASMVYIAVVVYGFPSSAAGALLTGIAMRFLGVLVEGQTSAGASKVSSP